MDERAAAEAILEMYEARLQFIDVYDQLLDKITEALKDAGKRDEPIGYLDGYCPD